jgi:hypothetical protein
LASDEISRLDFAPINRLNLKGYEEFLNEIFAKKHLNRDYLDWLYFRNPNGSVVGFDAFDKGRLVGHYACIPIVIDSYDSLALLSLNTAVSEDFQGKGLFRKLALKTFEISKQDFSCVIGVANSKSFRGFVRYLGFENLGELNLRFGRLDRLSGGQRIYSAEEILWRKGNPSGALSVKFLDGGKRALLLKRYRKVLNLKSIVKVVDSNHLNSKKLIKQNFGFTVDWKYGEAPIIYLPKKFKPSPLHLIFKPLNCSECKLTSWSFPDFDIL